MKRTSDQKPVYSSVIRRKLLIQPSALIAVVIIIGLLLVVWKIPQWQVGTAPLQVEEKARIDAETSARVALIQGIGGLLVFVTAGVSWLNLRATQRNVLVAEEKQVTERFSKAVEMLSNKDSIYTRLGGIYALERIAKDSAKDHWQVMEILTAFVREKARLKNDQEPFHITDHYAEAEVEMLRDPYEAHQDGYEEWDGITRTPNRSYIHPTPVDIQAVLTALGRRNRNHENGEQQNLDLSRTDLRGVVLTGDLAGINFKGADLQWAELKEVNLMGANLAKTNLELAKFEETKLHFVNLEAAKLHWVKFISTAFYKANLKGTDLSETDFQKSNLAHAILTNTNFSDAKLSESTRATLKQANLKQARFDRVDLSGINLEGANLESAYFNESNLNGANLAKANLKKAHLEEANLEGANLERAKLQDVNFSNAKLTKAVLKYANLSCAILEKANFEGANFEKAILACSTLRWANLKQANFNQTNFNQANFKGVRLDKVDLSLALRLTREQVESAKNWEEGIYNAELQEKLGLLAADSES
jgi:uncharacterized protein YjbI with pentapeptide repeats